MRLVVALGANLGDRLGALEAAVLAMGRDLGPVVARSNVHETPALVAPGADPTGVPAYLNAAVLIDVDTDAETALERLQAIERGLGRDRLTEGGRWRPRLIDLDIIAVDERVIERPRLTVPHPEMHRRSFVLRPMAEIWPGWRHPRLSRTTRELLEACEAGSPFELPAT